MTMTALSNRIVQRMRKDTEETLNDLRNTPVWVRNLLWAPLIITTPILLVIAWKIHATEIYLAEFLLDHTITLKTAGTSPDQLYFTLSQIMNLGWFSIALLVAAIPIIAGLSMILTFYLCGLIFRLKPDSA